MACSLATRSRRPGGLAHLRDGARRRREVVGPERLHGVDHGDRRAAPARASGRRGRGRSRRSRRCGRRRRCARRACAPAPATPRRTPAAPGARAASRASAMVGERRLADARVAADQDQRAGDEPAAEHAIELVDARGQPVVARRLDVGQRLRAADLAGARDRRRACPAGRDASSTIDAHALQLGQRPCHLGWDAPHSWQVNWVFVASIGPAQATRRTGRRGATKRCYGSGMRAIAITATDGPAGGRPPRARRCPSPATGRGAGARSRLLRSTTPICGPRTASRRSSGGSRSCSASTARAPSTRSAPASTRR